MELPLALILSSVWLALSHGQNVPKFVLPLGNTTVHREVMSGRDAHLPPSSQCFVFSPGHPDLPYDPFQHVKVISEAVLDNSRRFHMNLQDRALKTLTNRALTLTGEDNSYVDFFLNGQVDFRDFTLSLYIFPIGAPEGTILNYLCETGNVIKLSVLQGLLFVSFWDEYGVSVGVTAIPELLVPNEWNHLSVSREFDSGRIRIHHNTDLVDDIDDDFPNKIRLPTKGSFRLGSSQKEESEPKFKGRFACFQMSLSVLSDEEVVNSKEYCLPKSWNLPPEITLETKEIDGVEKKCVTDYVAPPMEGVPEPKDCTIISPACLYSGQNWGPLLRKHQWKESDRNSAHFHLIARDVVPTDMDNVLGDVLMYEDKSCPTLCLRVSDCKAFSHHPEDTNTTRCVMYRVVPGTERTTHPGAVLFSLV